jgi:hypothetical protein
MRLAMMASAQGHGELIADLSAERAMLREAQMVCICGPARANQTRLFGNKFDVLLVSESARLGMDQLALVVAVGSDPFGRPEGGGAVGAGLCRTTPGWWLLRNWEGTQGTQRRSRQSRVF